MTTRKKKTRRKANKKKQTNKKRGKMTTSMTTKDNGEISTYTSADWGVELLPQDIDIPKIMLMQAMSDKVTNGDAKIGEFRVSTSGDLLGTMDEGVELIPVHMDKLWYVFKKIGNDKEFDRVEGETPQNANHAFETDTEVWQKVLNFYVLRVDEVEQGAAMPYVVSFKGTGFRTGKSLMNLMYVRNVAAKQAPFSTVIKLYAKKEQNDKGTFCVPLTKPVRVATDGEFAVAADWNKTVRTIGTNVDDSDITKKNFSSVNDSMEEVEVKF